MSIKYSDGDVEGEILDILKEAKDISASCDIAYDKYDKWAIKYHLSTIRHNSIRHLDFSGLDVLEFGAGMGAMSRFVAEKARHLTVVEGTQKRFDCLKERLRDLDNWEGFIANYQDFHSDRKYDVVCFFGVLEYAGLYIDAPDAFKWAIAHAKSFLKEDGVLLISIENKNGLKYFSGASEDHYAQYFAGICGYSYLKGIKTFSRKEMFEMLSSFNSVSVQHLLPDYKCTKLVLTDEFVEKHPMVSADIMGEFESEDYLLPHRRYFPEKLAYMSLAKSGLLGEFSNSYLFIATNDENSDTSTRLLHKDDGLRAVVYSNGRKNDVATKFIEKDNVVKVRKNYIFKAKEESSLIQQNFNDEDLIEGDKLSTILFNLAYYNNPKEFLDLFERYIESCLKKYDSDVQGELLQSAFDAIPHNCIVKDGEFFNFDYEYKINFPFKKSHFILRNVLYTYPPINKWALFKDPKDSYLYFCKRFDIEANFERDMKLEDSVISAVYKPSLTKKGFSKKIKHPLMYLAYKLSFGRRRKINKEKYNNIKS